MGAQEPSEPSGGQATDFDDPERGADDESVENGEDDIDESGRNPTQRAIDGDEPVGAT